MKPRSAGQSANTEAPARKTTLDLTAIGLLIACCVFWGFQQALIKATMSEVPPIFQGAVRFAIATAALMAWMHWRGQSVFESDASLRAGLWVGALFVLEFAFLYLALSQAPASRVTLLLYTSPFVVALVLPFFVRGERLNRLQFIGLVLAFLGVTLAMVDDPTAGQVSLRGDVLALLAAIAWGLTTVAIRATGLTRVGAEKLLLYQVAAAALCFPVLSLMMGERWSFSLSAFAWGSIILQALVGAFVSYLTWMWLLGRYPATKVASFSFLTPVFALIFGALWLREPVSLALVTSLGLVAGGLWLVNRT